MVAAVADLLVDAVGSPWLAAEVAAPFTRARFAAAFAGAARRVGRAPIALDAERAAALRDAGFALARDGSTGADECARAALVAAAIAALPADEHVALVSGLVRRGDLRERAAVLRVLACLPEPARFAALAIDALRTNALDVFAAIACDNPLPARCFDEHAFGQMILKALFVGAPLARVIGLGARTTPELVRMVEAFASERRAAGRDVPADAALILEASR